MHQRRCFRREKLVEVKTNPEIAVCKISEVLSEQPRMTLTKKDVEQIMKWKDEINKVGGGLQTCGGFGVGNLNWSLCCGWIQNERCER